MPKPKTKTKPKTRPRAQARAAPKRGGAKAAAQLAKLRELCTQFEHITERDSHGHPTFFFKKRVFFYFLDNHHDDGRLALWLPQPPGAQAMLVDSDPDVYFVPPYCGAAGWIGVRLDRDPAWSQVESLIESAHEFLQSKKR